MASPSSRHHDLEARVQQMKQMSSRHSLAASGGDNGHFGSLLESVESSLGGLRQEVHAMKQLGSSHHPPALRPSAAAADPLDSLLALRQLLPHRRYAPGGSDAGSRRSSLGGGLLHAQASSAYLASSERGLLGAAPPSQAAGDDAGGQQAMEERIYAAVANALKAAAAAAPPHPAALGGDEQQLGRRQPQQQQAREASLLHAAAPARARAGGSDQQQPWEHRLRQLEHAVDALRGPEGAQDALRAPREGLLGELKQEAAAWQERLQAQQEATGVLQEQLQELQQQQGRHEDANHARQQLQLQDIRQELMAELTGICKQQEQRLSLEVRELREDMLSVLEGLNIRLQAVEEEQEGLIDVQQQHDQDLQTLLSMQQQQQAAAKAQAAAQPASTDGGVENPAASPRGLTDGGAPLSPRPGLPDADAHMRVVSMSEPGHPVLPAPAAGDQGQQLGMAAGKGAPAQPPQQPPHEDGMSLPFELSESQSLQCVSEPSPPSSAKPEAAAELLLPPTAAADGSDSSSSLQVAALRQQLDDSIRSLEQRLHTLEQQHAAAAPPSADAGVQPAAALEARVAVLEGASGSQQRAHVDMEGHVGRLVELLDSMTQQLQGLETRQQEQQQQLQQAGVEEGLAARVEGVEERQAELKGLLLQQHQQQLQQLPSLRHAPVAGAEEDPGSSGLGSSQPSSVTVRLHAFEEQLSAAVRRFAPEHAAVDPADQQQQASSGDGGTRQEQGLGSLHGLLAALQADLAQLAGRLPPGTADDGRAAGKTTNTSGSDDALQLAQLARSCAELGETVARLELQLQGVDERLEHEQRAGGATQQALQQHSTQLSEHDQQLRRLAQLRHELEAQLARWTAKQQQAHLEGLAAVQGSLEQQQAAAAQQAQQLAQAAARAEEAHDAAQQVQVQLRAHEQQHSEQLAVLQEATGGMSEQMAGLQAAQAAVQGGLEQQQAVAQQLAQVAARADEANDAAQQVQAQVRAHEQQLREHAALLEGQGSAKEVLQQHGEQLAVLQGASDGMAGELAGVQAAQADLQQQLQQQQQATSEALSHVTEELQAQQAQLADHAQQLAEHEGVVAQLQQLMRDAEVAREQQHALRDALAAVQAAVAAAADAAAAAADDVAPAAGSGEQQPTEDADAPLPQQPAQQQQQLDELAEVVFGLRVELQNGLADLSQQLSGFEGLQQDLEIGEASRKAAAVRAEAAAAEALEKAEAALARLAEQETEKAAAAADSSKAAASAAISELQQGLLEVQEMLHPLQVGLVQQLTGGSVASGAAPGTAAGGLMTAEALEGQLQEQEQRLQAALLAVHHKQTELTGELRDVAAKHEQQLAALSDTQGQQQALLEGLRQQLDATCGDVVTGLHTVRGQQQTLLEEQQALLADVTARQDAGAQEIARLAGEVAELSTDVAIAGADLAAAVRDAAEAAKQVQQLRGDMGEALSCLVPFVASPASGGGSSSGLSSPARATPDVSPLRSWPRSVHQAFANTSRQTTGAADGDAGQATTATPASGSLWRPEPHRVSSADKAEDGRPAAADRQLQELDSPSFKAAAAGDAAYDRPGSSSAAAGAAAVTVAAAAAAVLRRGDAQQPQQPEHSDDSPRRRGSCHAAEGAARHSSTTPLSAPVTARSITAEEFESLRGSVVSWSMRDSAVFDNGLFNTPRRGSRRRRGQSLTGSIGASAGPTGSSAAAAAAAGHTGGSGRATTGGMPSPHVGACSDSLPLASPGGGSCSTGSEASSGGDAGLVSLTASVQALRLRQRREPSSQPASAPPAVRRELAAVVGGDGGADCTPLSVYQNLAYEGSSAGGQGSSGAGGRHPMKHLSRTAAAAAGGADATVTTSLELMAAAVAAGRRYSPTEAAAAVRSVAASATPPSLGSWQQPQSGSGRQQWQRPEASPGAGMQQPFQAFADTAAAAQQQPTPLQQGISPMLSALLSESYEGSSSVSSDGAAAGQQQQQEQRAPTERQLQQQQRPPLSAAVLHQHTLRQEQQQQQSLAAAGLSPCLSELLSMGADVIDLDGSEADSDLLSGPLPTSARRSAPGAAAAAAAAPAGAADGGDLLRRQLAFGDDDVDADAAHPGSAPSPRCAGYDGQPVLRLRGGAGYEEPHPLDGDLPLDGSWQYEGDSCTSSAVAPGSLSAYRSEGAGGGDGKDSVTAALSSAAAAHAVKGAALALQSLRRGVGSIGAVAATAAAAAVARVHTGSSSDGGASPPDACLHPGRRQEHEEQLQDEDLALQASWMLGSFSSSESEESEDVSDDGAGGEGSSPDEERWHLLMMQRRQQQQDGKSSSTSAAAATTSTTPAAAAAPAEACAARRPSGGSRARRKAAAASAAAAVEVEVPQGWLRPLPATWQAGTGSSRSGGSATGAPGPACVPHAAYRVALHTSAKPGSGTKARVLLVLSSAGGCSPVVTVTHKLGAGSKRCSLKPGSTVMDWFSLPPAGSTGASTQQQEEEQQQQHQLLPGVSAVKVWHDAAGFSGAWLLEWCVVQHLRSGDWWQFDNRGSWIKGGRQQQQAGSSAAPEAAAPSSKAADEAADHEAGPPLSGSSSTMCFRVLQLSASGVASNCPLPPAPFPEHGAVAAAAAGGDGAGCAAGREQQEQPAAAAAVGLDDVELKHWGSPRRAAAAAHSNSSSSLTAGGDGAVAGWGAAAGRSSSLGGGAGSSAADVCAPSSRRVSGSIAPAKLVPLQGSSSGYGAVPADADHTDSSVQQQPPQLVRCSSRYLGRSSSGGSGAGGGSLTQQQQQQRGVKFSAYAEQLEFSVQQRRRRQPGAGSLSGGSSSVESFTEEQLLEAQGGWEFVRPPAEQASYSSLICDDAGGSGSNGGGSPVAAAAAAAAGCPAALDSLDDEAAAAQQQQASLEDVPLVAKHQQQQPSGGGSYVLRLHTADRLAAGLPSGQHVCIEVVGSSGVVLAAQLPSTRGAFSRGMCDAFGLASPAAGDIGAVQAVRLWLEPPAPKRALGGDGGWCLARVEVEALLRGTTFSFANAAGSDGWVSSRGGREHVVCLTAPCVSRRDADAEAAAAEAHELQRQLAANAALGARDRETLAARLAALQARLQLGQQQQA